MLPDRADHHGPLTLIGDKGYAGRGFTAAFARATQRSCARDAETNPDTDRI
jgi:hypothetical protein